jgi:ketosteroid isomerase-like protein
MSTETAIVTGVVEQMLDHPRDRPLGSARARARRALRDRRARFSSRYGGSHHGVGGYVALMQRIGELFELAFELQGVYALDVASVVLRMLVTFTARGTGRSIQLRVIEVLEVANGRVCRSEVFLADTAALLETLAAD